MRKLLCSLAILAMIFAAVGGFAATEGKVYKYVPKTTAGKPIPKGFIKFEGYDTHNMAQFKAQNHLSYAMNQKIKNQGLKAKKGSFVKCTIDSIPCFQSWFITGSRNSVYPYTIVGQAPTVGATTGINNQIIPLISVLTVGRVPLYVFDPTVATDPQGAASVPSIGPGTDTGLLSQAPLYDATTTYVGPPPETGQYNDSHQRVSFRKVAAANWHTVLKKNLSSGVIWVQFLESNNGDWACIGGEAPPCTSFPVFNINTISKSFSFILSAEFPPNNEIPIILTDWLTAFDPSSGACCILGFHTAQAGIQDPLGVLVWTWGTWIPYNADNGFTNPFNGGFGSNSMVLSHEVDEIFNDPFVNTAVSPWIDGSVSFAQANLETGDAIEAMAPADVLFDVTLTTTGGPFVYVVQNVPTLEWFFRTPFNGGIYSWPNEGSLSHNPHGVNCHTPFVCSWLYGQGSAGFFFGPPF